MKLHLHDYTAWSDPIATYRSEHKQQWKVCKICNKARFRTSDYDTQSLLSNVLEAIKSVKDKK